MKLTNMLGDLTESIELMEAMRNHVEEQLDVIEEESWSSDSGIITLVNNNS